jgi:tetratricopeptide (TPR) repeat protein
MTCTPCDTAPAVEALLAEGVSALVDAGDLAEARRWFDAAFREAERLGDAEAMAEAALGLGGLWVHEQRTLAGSTLLTQRLRQALSLVDHRSALGLRLRIRLAGEAAYRDSQPTAILTLLDEAGEVGDPVVRAEALSIAHHCLLSPEHGRLRRRLAEELVGESFRTRHRSDLLMGLLWRVVDLFLAGDDHAGRRLVELKEQLSRQDHLAVGYVVSAIDVMLAIRSGELGRAESLAKACAQRGAAAGDIDATGWYGAQLVAIRWYQGRVVEMLPMLDELVDSPTLSAVDNGSLAALAVAAAVAGDGRRAASALARLCGRDLADLPRSSSWLGTMNGIVEAADLLADTRTAARAYELLKPYAHLPMVGSLGVVCFGSVHQALGVASMTTGDLDRAIEHLRTAVRRNLALAHWPAVVGARRRLAQALTRRGRPRDVTDAEQERSAAAAEAAALDITQSDVDDRASTRTASCARHGRHWRVSLGNRSVLVGHRIGMLYLAVLIANPRQEIDAVDLAAGPAALNAAHSGGGSSQPLLDPAARREYQRRLAELRLDIDRLEAGNDTGGAARAYAERDWILGQLSAAAGVGGRARGFPTNRERARIAVGKAIRRALEHISKSDPVVAAHLTQAVRTGVRCSYWPV